MINIDLSDILRLARKLDGFQEAFKEELQTAGDESVKQFIQEEPNNTNWMNSNGDLDSSFYQLKSSPYEAVAASNSPYAHRRQWSFKGPDSLGRMFPNDPASMFATHTLDNNQGNIEQFYIQAAQRALVRIGAV